MSESISKIISQKFIGASISTTGLIFIGTHLLWGNLAEAKILRSAALYYAPEGQLETRLLESYQTQDNAQLGIQSTRKFFLTGAQIEYGFSDFFSTSAAFNYGTGEKSLRSIYNSTSAPSSNTNISGFTDPQFALKTHFQGQNVRFHIDGIVSVKSDVQVLTWDQTPLNYSTGGSTLALNLGLEGALGPMTFGLEGFGDLWKDNQEVLLHQVNHLETTYLQEGGKKYGLQAFGEISSIRSMKPGFKLGWTQVQDKVAHIESNEIRTSSVPLLFRRSQEQIVNASIYGRVRISNQVIFNVDLEGLQSNIYNGTSKPLFNTMAIHTQLGFKF